MISNLVEGSLKSQMEDIEIVHSPSDLLAERDVERERMQCEMGSLLVDMDGLLKDKSILERTHSVIKRKMERSLQECQDIIDRLSKDLKASERTNFRLREQSKSAEEKYFETSNCLDSIKRERNQLSAKNSELKENADQLKSRNEELITKLDFLTTRVAELEKVFLEEKQKSHVHSYLKDYVEFLENELEVEKKRTENIEFKDLLFKQLSLDHEASQAALSQEIDHLKAQLEKKYSDQNSSSITLSSAHSNSEMQEEQSQQKLINSSHHPFMNHVESKINEIYHKDRLEVSNNDDLYEVIDIDAYLMRIENQVDKLNLRSKDQNRNDILKKHLELSLRGIRQLCDLRNINMEYTI